MKISTPDTLTMTVFDLPGLKPDESDPQFHEIAAIYQHIMSEYCISGLHTVQEHPTVTYDCGEHKGKGFD